MHRFLSRRGGSAGLSALRHARVPPASLVPRFIDTVAFVASATASSSRSDDDAMSVTSWRRSNKEIDAVPPPPFGLMGVAGDLCVTRRRRCPCIAFSLLLDLASQAPSANVTISMKRDTERTRRGQPVADPNRTSGTFFTRVASVLPSELFGRATRGEPPARPYGPS